MGLGREERASGSWPGSTQQLGQWCYCVPGCLPVTNLLTSCLSLLPPFPSTALPNNHYLFKHSACVGSGLRLQARNKCLSVEQPTVFMLSQTASSLSF